jgi:hypothetical protein
MPPQQPDRLLDLFNEAFDFSAHESSDLRRGAATDDDAKDVAARAAKRNRLERFRAKGRPVRAKKTRQNKKLKSRFDSIETGL